MHPITELKEILLLRHSKAQCQAAVNWVGDQPDRFDVLFECFASNDALLSQRAAWALSYTVQAHPAFINKHWSRLLKILAEPHHHPAIRRNGFRLMQDIHIPKRFQGKAMDLCFRWIETPHEPVAIKAFALTILYQLSLEYPEIIPELRTVIESVMPQESIAFRNRAGKFLKQWSKL